MKRFLGAIFMLLGVFLLVINPAANITGYAILSADKIYSYSLFIISWICIIGGIFLLTSRKTLDAIIILGTSVEEDLKRRTRRALKVSDEGIDPKVYVASGGKTPHTDPKYKHQAHMIYKQLRDAGIKPTEIRIGGRSQNSIDNVLYSLEKVDGNEIGIVSNPRHLDRIEYIVKKGKEDGSIDKKVHIHRIETESPVGGKSFERVYEGLIMAYTKYKLRKGLKNAHTYGWLPNLLGSTMNYILKKIQKKEQ